MKERMQRCEDWGWQDIECGKVAVEGGCGWDRLVKEWSKRNCVASSFSCGKGMSAPLRVRSRAAALLPSLQDEQKGERLGRLLSLSMGDASPFVRSWRPYLELAGSVALVVAILFCWRKNYLTKNLIRMWVLGFAFYKEILVIFLSATLLSLRNVIGFPRI